MLPEEWEIFHKYFKKPAGIIKTLASYPFTIGIGGHWKFKDYDICCIVNYDGKVSWYQYSTDVKISFEEAMEQFSDPIKEELLFHMDIFS